MSSILSNDSPTLAHPEWRQARAELSGGPDGGLNMAWVAVDRHELAGDGERVAIRWLGVGGDRKELTYGELGDAARRFSALLDRLGVAAGDRVLSLAGRIPELYVALLGSLRHGAVFSPLFSAFGPEPIRTRLELGKARLLITTDALFRRKVAPLLADLPHLEHVLIVGGDSAQDSGERCLDFGAALAAEEPATSPPTTRPEDPALLHFTSGTTGQPKGAMHVHEAVVGHFATARSVLDLRPGTRYWCTADPGWVTGISYGAMAPLVAGATLLLDEGELEGDRWFRILEEERIEVWYTSPTAIRMLERLGPEARAGRSFPNLRLLASVGEPLEAAAVRWGEEAFGHPFFDTWWQTETGAICIANRPGLELRAGAMGRPVPGIEAAVMRRRDDGTLAEIDAPGEVGELALRAGWPSMFRSYLDAPELYARSFRDGFYLSGDLARRDEEGYFWFVGRADDAIQSAGHLIGPTEVERVLLGHPAVLEAAAVGRPDPKAFEVVKAFVVLRPGFEAGSSILRELRAHGRAKLGPSIAPREIEFRDELPKNRSGKILRRVLRDEEARRLSSTWSANDKEPPDDRS